MTAALKVDNLTVEYGGFTALDQVSLELAPNTTLGLVGESVPAPQPTAARPRPRVRHRG